MRRIGTFFAVISVLLLALTAAAQQEPGTLARAYFVNVKRGMEQQFEAAYKGHIEWHRQQKDTWVWHTWQIVNGEQLGQFVIRAPGHHWKDFDAHAEFGAADETHWLANVAQYVESESGIIQDYLPDISRWPEGDAMPPLVSVIRFHLNPGGTPDFQNAVKKFHEAIGKTDWPAHYAWLALVNGGEHPTFTLVLPHKNWADAKGPEKPFDKMVEEAYGPHEAGKLLESFGKAIHCQHSQMARFRSELSYQPASQ